MMSSQDSMDLVLKCFQRGASDFLVKPVRKNELKNLWQHVWRKCNSSSGSGSGSGCLRDENASQPKSHVGNAHGSAGTGGDERGGGGSGSGSGGSGSSLNATRGGSDNGSGTQMDAAPHVARDRPAKECVKEVEEEAEESQRGQEAAEGESTGRGAGDAGSGSEETDREPCARHSQSGGEGKEERDGGEGQRDGGESAGRSESDAGSDPDSAPSSAPSVEAIDLLGGIARRQQQEQQQQEEEEQQREQLDDGEEPGGQPPAPSHGLGEAAFPPPEEEGTAARPSGRAPDDAYGPSSAATSSLSYPYAPPLETAAMADHRGYEEDAPLAEGDTDYPTAHGAGGPGDAGDGGARLYAPSRAAGQLPDLAGAGRQWGTGAVL